MAAPPFFFGRTAWKADVIFLGDAFFLNGSTIYGVSQTAQLGLF